MLVPLAAFVLAGMESLPAAVFWSLIIGIVQQAVFYSFTPTCTPKSCCSSSSSLVWWACLRAPVHRAGRFGPSHRFWARDFIAVREVTPIPDALRRQREIISVGHSC